VHSVIWEPTHDITSFEVSILTCHFDFHDNIKRPNDYCSSFKSGRFTYMW